MQTHIDGTFFSFSAVISSGMRNAVKRIIVDIFIHNFNCVDAIVLMLSVEDNERNS